MSIFHCSVPGDEDHFFPLVEQSCCVASMHCLRLVMSCTANQRQSLVSQAMCWGIAGLNCKEISVRDRCVCVHAYLHMCVYTCIQCEPKVINARCVTRAEPSGHGAAIQHAPVCVQVFIYLHECAHSGLLVWDMTSFLVSVYECVCACVRGCLSCQKWVCPWSLGTAPSTRCAVGSITWHGLSLPLYRHKYCSMSTPTTIGCW